jgi:hypothetical protein
MLILNILIFNILEIHSFSNVMVNLQVKKLNLSINLILMINKTKMIKKLSELYMKNKMNALIKLYKVSIN